MKAKTLNKLLKDYQKIFENLGFTINPDFKKDFLHIKRMKTNGTKISFIKADKIKGLKENIKGFAIKPNDSEQREKYFQAVKPTKFLDNLLLKHNKSTLFSNIAEQFNKDFINNLKSKLVLFSDSDISKIYNEASVVGCMAKSCQSWFKVYDKTENLKLATLTDEADTVLIRSLLWHDKQNNNYWLDNSYEQAAINGDNEVREQYQEKLIRQVLEHLGADKWKTHCKNNYKFGCSFAHRLGAEVQQQIMKDFNTTIYKGVTIYTGSNEATQNERVLLKPIIKDFAEEEYHNFPYSDTFQSIDRSSGEWDISDNSGDTNFICCRSTEGEDENDSGTICESCENRIADDDYIHYSECEEMHICDECSTYIEERDDSCMSDNAIYNNYTGNYIYRHDIE